MPLISPCLTICPYIRQERVQSVVKVIDFCSRICYLLSVTDLGEITRANQIILDFLSGTISDQYPNDRQHEYIPVTT